MPSEKILEQKKQAVAELSEQLKNSCTGVIVDYKGITVADDTKLRKALREAGTHYSVVKNTLLGRALEADGIEVPVGRTDIKRAGRYNRNCDQCKRLCFRCKDSFQVCRRK